MEKYDIVYTLKNDIKPDELRYSLRSLKNFSHGKVWFYGGIPSGLNPDEMVPFQQEGRTKYSRTRSTFDAICRNDEITEKFWLFNDDFFCLHKVDKMPQIYNGTIAELVLRIEDKYGTVTPYSQRMRSVMKQLREDGCDIKNYAVHLPILLDRQKVLQIPEEYKNLPLRQAYGNLYNIGTVEQPDVKITDNVSIPDDNQVWVSTSDISWRHGKVGECIRRQFPEKSIYEG